MILAELGLGYVTHSEAQYENNAEIRCLMPGYKTEAEARATQEGEAAVMLKDLLAAVAARTESPGRDEG